MSWWLPGVVYFLDFSRINIMAGTCDPVGGAGGRRVRLGRHPEEKDWRACAAAAAAGGGGAPEARQGGGRRWPARPPHPDLHPETPSDGAAGDDGFEETRHQGIYYCKTTNCPRVRL